MSRLIFVFFLVFASSVLVAGCSLDAYKNSCANCKFDEKGKMDRACYEQYKTIGITCIATKYPITNELYLRGRCPEINDCASQLSACVSASSSGDDRKDCITGATRHCYVAADECIEKASNVCANRSPPMCSSSALAILLTLGLLAFHSFNKK